MPQLIGFGVFIAIVYAIFSWLWENIIEPVVDFFAAYGLMIIGGIVALAVFIWLWNILISSSKKKTQKLQDNIDSFKYMSKFDSLEELNSLLSKDAKKIIWATRRDYSDKWAEFLCRAAKENNFELVKKMISNSLDVNLKDSNNTSALCYALSLREENFELVKYLVSKKINLEDTNSKSETALIIASRMGHFNSVELLLSKKAKLDAVDEDGYTALLTATLYDNIDIVKILVNKGSDIETKTIDGSTPLIIAADGGFIEIISFLLEKNANIEATNEHSSTPLLAAISYGHKNIVEVLVENNINLEAKTKEGQTGLILASLLGFDEIVRILLQKGADIESRDNNAHTALMNASIEGKTDVVSVLIETADVNAKDSSGLTALHYAAAQGHDDIINLLLAADADIEAESDNEITALILASTQDKREAGQLLINRGAIFDINNSDICAVVTNNLYGTAYETINGAIIDNNLDAVKLFLAQGWSIEAIDEDGETPLLVAAGEGHFEIVKYLVENSANIEAYTNENGTSLSVSSSGGYIEIVKLLIENGANIEVISENGATPLLFASNNGNTETVEFLLNHDAQIEARTLGGSTPLIVASHGGHKVTVEILLKNGADIEAINDEKQTALHHASHGGHRDTVEILLENGADIEALSNENETALSLAASNENEDVVKLLIQKGAKFDISDEVASFNVTKNLFDSGYKTIKAAVQNNDIQATELFLAQGSDINISIGDGLLVVASFNGYFEMVKFLVNNGVDLDKFGVSSLCMASQRDHYDVVNFLLNKGVDINGKLRDDTDSVIKAACHGSNNALGLLLGNRNLKNPLFTKVVNKIELSGYENITLELNTYDTTQIGVTLYYNTDYEQHFDWVQKTDEIKKLLGLQHIELVDDHSGKYIIKVYNNSNESKLIRNLIVNSKKPEFVQFVEEDHTSYIFFKSLAGLTIEHWNEQKTFIEHELQLPVDIEIYDSTHRLYPNYGEDSLIVIVESNISVMPDSLALGGKYLKTEVENGYQAYYFENVDDIDKWHENKDKIVEFLDKRINIVKSGIHVKLVESVEESIPKLLGLIDSNKNTPILHTVKEDGENKLYFYTFLPELDLNEWKEKSKKVNFRTLFNEPDKVYNLDIYDKTNEALYDKDFFEGQLIVLQELAKIPNKEALIDKNAIEELQTDKIFWGYGSGSHRYYTDLSLLSHMMIIGASGSGKSNFINGIILSILNSVESVKKLYLIDLKSGIEFNRYKDLESDKITVFSRGTKPSKLLAALHEVEAEMYLREEYMVANNIIKMDKDPIFVIIDEFAQINLMHARGEEMQAKEEIYDTLIRIGTRARSANIKLIVQTQDPKSVGEDLKVHLMSRVLLKTGKDLDREFTLQNPDMMDELGIKHTKFDKGRFVFEDYNEGDTLFNELQFPFINPDKQYHLNFKENAQSHTEMDESIYDEYKEYIASEYDYLGNTKLLGSGKIEVEPVVEQVIEEAYVETNTIGNDDFDFDSLLDDVTAEEASASDEISEINDMYSDAKDLLEELKKGK